MGEEYVVVDGLTVSYSGLFKIRDLLAEIDEFLTSKFYTKEEKLDEEKITSKGRNISIKMEYKFKKTNYIKYIVEIKLIAKDVKEVVVAKGSRKLKYNDGDVTIELSSRLKTDTEGQWTAKPGLVFIGHVIDRYLYPIYTSKEISELESQTHHLKDTIKSFLNLYKF